VGRVGSGHAPVISRSSQTSGLASAGERAPESAPRAAPACACGRAGGAAASPPSPDSLRARDAASGAERMRCWAAGRRSQSRAASCVGAAQSRAAKSHSITRACLALRCRAPGRHSGCAAPLAAAPASAPLLPARAGATPLGKPVGAAADTEAARGPPDGAGAFRVLCGLRSASLEEELLLLPGPRTVSHSGCGWLAADPLPASLRQQQPRAFWFTLEHTGRRAETAGAPCRPRTLSSRRDGDAPCAVGSSACAAGGLALARRGLRVAADARQRLKVVFGGPARGHRTPAAREQPIEDQSGTV